MNVWLDDIDGGTRTGSSCTAERRRTEGSGGRQRSDRQLDCAGDSGASLTEHAGSGAPRSSLSITRTPAPGSRRTVASSRGASTPSRRVDSPAARASSRPTTAPRPPFFLREGSRRKAASSDTLLYGDVISTRCARARPHVYGGSRERADSCHSGSSSGGSLRRPSRCTGRPFG
jgi:hypothetical protein